MASRFLYLPYAEQNKKHDSSYISDTPRSRPSFPSHRKNPAKGEYGFMITVDNHGDGHFMGFYLWIMHHHVSNAK